MYTKEEVENHLGYKFLLQISDPNFNDETNLEQLFTEIAGTNNWLKSVCDLVDNTCGKNILLILKDKQTKQWRREQTLIAIRSAVGF